MVAVSSSRPALSISPELSVYLDFVRFFAAVLVVIGHASQDGLYLGRFLLDDYGHEAVIIFFVLSGLVITSTASRPRETLRSYSVARLARLYSVVLPAIVFALAIAFCGASLGSGIWEWFSSTNQPLIAIMSSLLFLNESWLNDYSLPWNAPYWSLCYEAWYYVIFGCFFFLRGIKRWSFVALAAAIAGPRILALFPIWLLGSAVAKGLTKCPSNSPIGWTLVLLSTLVIISISDSGIDIAIKEYLHNSIPGWWRLASSQRVVTDLFLGFFVAVNFIGFQMAARSVSAVIARIKRPILFFSGFTFSIYLFHRPMIKLASFLHLNNQNSFFTFCLLVTIVIAICILLGSFTERRVHTVKLWITRSFGKLALMASQQRTSTSS